VSAEIFLYELFGVEGFVARLKQLSQSVNHFLLSFSSEAFQHQLVAKIIGVLCWL
jgi:hypothetical protein